LNYRALKWKTSLAVAVAATDVLLSIRRQMLPVLKLLPTGNVRFLVTKFTYKVMEIKLYER